MSDPPPPRDPLAALEALHADVDAAARPLVALHAERLQCRLGCTQCCVDDLQVFEIEAARIRAHCGDVLRETAHPPGACAFLGADGACRIYAHRPYVCRTQGLPLRWIAEAAPPGAGPVELRDICLLNDAGEPIEALPPEACWTIGPTEGRLAGLESARSGGRPRRVRLRDLFGDGGQVVKLLPTATT